MGWDQGLATTFHKPNPRSLLPCSQLFGLQVSQLKASNLLLNQGPSEPCFATASSKNVSKIEELFKLVLLKSRGKTFYRSVCGDRCLIVWQCDREIRRRGIWAGRPGYRAAATQSATDPTWRHEASHRGTEETGSHADWRADYKTDGPHDHNPRQG